MLKYVLGTPFFSEEFTLFPACVPVRARKLLRAVRLESWDHPQYRGLYYQCSILLEVRSLRKAEIRTNIGKHLNCHSQLTR